VNLPFELIVASKTEAGVLLVSRSRRPRWAVSFGAPGTGTPEGWDQLQSKRKLRLEFDDIDQPTSLWYVGPNPRQITQLLEFGERIDGGRVLVHCAAGISRSAAGAFILATQALGPGSEHDALQHIYDIRQLPDGDTVWPNRLMVKIADGLLRRNGAMTEALKTMGGSLEGKTA